MTSPIPPLPAVRQPYMGEPLLTPGMVHGIDCVRPDDLAELRRYLEALVAVRGTAIHVNVAFNSVYFGYDLGGEGYGAGPLDPWEFPRVVLGGAASALPVGAMVYIVTGSQPLFAEIVYKEGRHPAAGKDGDIPAWVSGAPPGATAPGQVPDVQEPRKRRELLIPDVRAFGTRLSLSTAQLTRLCSHQKWLNQDGHVLLDAVYESAAAAEKEEISAYAAYLLTTAREQLLSPNVPVSLMQLTNGGDEKTLQTALTSLLNMVHDVLASSDALRMWRGYAMGRADLAACWQDAGPLGGGDLRDLAASLEHAAVPTARRRYALPGATAVYTAIGPRLHAIRGSGPRLTGTGYGMAVCRSNLALADVIRGETDRGLFPSGNRVVLDDAFEGGGVWRSCRPGEFETYDDPLEPRGLGWITAIRLCAPHAASVSGPEPAVPLDEPLGDDADLGVEENLRMDDSEIVWRTRLRLTHIIDMYLPLRRDVADGLRADFRDRPSLRLELTHPEGEVEPHEAVQDLSLLLDDGSTRLVGIQWPMDFFPGLELLVQWPRGGRVLRATTTLLDAPVTVDGRVIKHRYDPAVFTRDNAPGSNRQRDTSAGLAPRDLVLRAVRRCGLLSPDGHAVLDPAALSSAVYRDEPTPAQLTLLKNAVAELIAAGSLRTATGSRSADGTPHHPARTGEPEIPLLEYAPAPGSSATPARLDNHAEHLHQKAPVRPYQVPGHLRRLLPGQTPGARQLAAYREHCQRLGKADGAELPLGYTFITPHVRGH